MLVNTAYCAAMAGEGVSFRIVDVDTFSKNEVVGRCFCSATAMRQAMKSNTPIVMSLGDGCACTYNTPNKSALQFASIILVVDLILLRPCLAMLRAQRREAQGAGARTAQVFQ